MNTPLAHSSLSPLFGEPCNHVPVPLKRLAGARLLWLNRRAIPEDPQFAAMGGDEDAYVRHILDACAYEIDATLPFSPDAPGGADLVGFADRYGGAGIGQNGGSGRGIHFNGYQIKGIGRTPLVSRLTKESHASGGAYLEECVRETIFSEVVATEFPYGAVPTLAIIDTGHIQTWHTPLGMKNERRTLLIRPCFLRPAHFERALGFVSGARKEGIQDHARVVRMFEGTAAILGQTSLRDMYDGFWTKWARQLAYSFVHRLPHGSNTTSNISLDGRLVDFGAMSAVPSWSNTATVFFHQPFREQFDCIIRSIKSLSYYFGRHLDPHLADDDAISELIARARKEYQQAVGQETLLLCGISGSVADPVVHNERCEGLWQLVASLIAHYQAEQLDMVYKTETPNLPWDIPLVWGTKVPRHLQPLRRVLDELVPLEEREAAISRCVFRAASRPLLYFSSAKESIYNALESDQPGGHADDRARIAVLIDMYVSQSVRMNPSQHYQST